MEQIRRAAEIRAFNLIFLYLGDNVIRKVDGMDNPIDLWNKLMTAPNLVYLKGMLFNFKMDASKSMDKNIDEFTRLILLSRGTDQALGDTSEPMILLNSLSEDYNVVKHLLQYIIPRLELVIFGIKARELELNTSKKLGNNLFIKGKSDKKSNAGNIDQSDGLGSKAVF